MKVGDRVKHERHGAGTVMAYDQWVEDNKIRSSGRYGITFDDHTILANPAYFYPEELQVIPAEEETK